MAMDINEKTTFNGDSRIGDTVAERYSASIDKQNPANLVFSRVIVNAQLRKDNREQCRADMAAFEDDVYAVQDQMIQTDSVKEVVEEVLEEEVEEDGVSET